MSETTQPQRNAGIIAPVSSEVNTPFPTFAGHYRNRQVTVAFEPATDELTVTEPGGHPMRWLLTARDDVNVDDGTFTWPAGNVIPADDDFGAAVALAHLVAVRIAVSPSDRQLAQPLPGAPRWQYAVVNTGTFRTAERFTEVLATAGRAGWELVTVYDKTTNWIGAFEKGFMLLKRPVPDDFEPEEWCITYRKT